MKQATHYRICILGNSGSGKSTLADRLSKIIHVPVIHLDRLFMRGQFIMRNHAELQAQHTATVNQEEWIIDGDYRYFLPERLALATLVVFLDVPRIKIMSRMIRRYFMNAYLATSMPDEARNGLSWKLIRWVSSYSRRKRLAELYEMAKVNPDLKILVLKDGTTKQWIEQITQALSQ